MQIHQVTPKTKSRKGKYIGAAENAALIRGEVSKARKPEREEK